MERLLEGYRTYRERRWPELRALHRQLAERGQSPKAMVIACADSRVDPATIFNAGPGELFVIRNVANLAPPFEQGAGLHGVSAAIEFAVTKLRVETVLVLGHAQCGGVAAALEQQPRDPPSFLDSWIGLLDPAIARLGAGECSTSALEYESIRVTLENLATFPFVREAVEGRGLELRGPPQANRVLERLEPQQVPVVGRRREDPRTMWEKGDIQRYMDANPGHNAISAHMAMTVDARIEAAKKEAAAQAAKNFKNKKNNQVMGGGSGARNANSDAMLKDPKKYGGRAAVAARRAGLI